MTAAIYDTLGIRLRHGRFSIYSNHQLRRTAASAAAKSPGGSREVSVAGRPSLLAAANATAQQQSHQGAAAAAAAPSAATPVQALPAAGVVAAASSNGPGDTPPNASTPRDLGQEPVPVPQALVTVFDTAQQNIFALLEGDSLPRYLRSNLFRTFLEQRTSAIP